MTEQNWAAVISMCAITITIYALRSSEAHYLPDLFGLALALAAPRQSYAIGAWLVVTLLRHSPLGYGLAGGLPAWVLWVVLPGAAHMLMSDAESLAIEDAYRQRISETETESGNSEISQPVAENSAEMITFAKVQTIAAYVISGEIGITKAIQIGAGCKGGDRYQKLSRLVHAEIERQRNHYPPGSNLKRFE